VARFYLSLASRDLENELLATVGPCATCWMRRPASSMNRKSNGTRMRCTLANAIGSTMSQDSAQRMESPKSAGMTAKALAKAHTNRTDLGETRLHIASAPAIKTSGVSPNID